MTDSPRAQGAAAESLAVHPPPGASRTLSLSPARTAPALRVQRSGNASASGASAKASMLHSPDPRKDVSISSSRASPSVIAPTYHTPPRRRATAANRPISPHSPFASSHTVGMAAMKRAHSGLRR